MVFASPTFLFLFLPLFLLGYYLVPARMRAIWMLAGSWMFYAWWRIDFLILLVVASVGGAVLGRAIDVAPPGTRRRRLLLSGGVITALGALAYFKYAAFVYDSVVSLATLIAPGDRFAQPGANGSWNIVLPVGISFFTFQVISYLVDVYRGTAPASKRIIDVAAYVSLFPQLVAGPIVRYSEIASQLVVRDHSIERFSQGAERFMVGLARKVLIADAVAPLADAAFSNVAAGSAPGIIGAWMGIVAYTLQIYFDFAAYSDMAIGLGLMIGFTFPENFRQPYLSRSITEFWRRWHITLSAWLRDYLYVPLGGNRRGSQRTLINLMTVMTLGGLWHGANWTFVVWGMWHGAWLIGERVAHTTPRAAADGLSRIPAGMRTSFATARTLIVVMIGWVLFRSGGALEAFRYTAALVGFPSGLAGEHLSMIAPEILWQTSRGALLGLGAGMLITIGEPKILRWLGRSRFGPAAIVFLFVLSIARLLAASFTPFLYFQF